MPLAEVNTFAGRYYLSVAGVVVAMQGDPCRDGELPEEVLDPIPQEELERATIGDKHASELPIKVVRFFRGDRWTLKMLEYVAGTINESQPAPTPSEAALNAAREIVEAAGGLTRKGLPVPEDIAAIISRHCAGEMK